MENPCNAARASLHVGDNAPAATMTDALVSLDHVLVPAVVVITLVEWLWTWPRSVRAIAAGVPGARTRAYRNIIVMEWALSACVLGLWVAQSRSWGVLLLGAVSPLRLGLGFALVALYLGLALTQRRALLADPERLARVARKLDYADALLPRTPDERRGMALTALTAGFCEELVFRGFAPWYLGHWMGGALAVAMSSLLFGFGHVYLGLAHVPRTALVGLVFALVVLASGSLWPAIVIHAAMDLVASDLGHHGLARQRSSATVPAG
jgi:membrane protease YdiL (CAAX protease family)